MQFPLNSEQLSHYIPLVVSYAVIVGLFLKNRRDLKRIRMETRDTVRVAASGVSNLSLEVQGIRESVRQIEECPVSAPKGPGLNPTKRAQVLRMYRRGETIFGIAAALRTPSAEVQLVLKLHHMLHAEN
jgi:hypothetical protein